MEKKELIELINSFEGEEVNLYDLIEILQKRIIEDSHNESPYTEQDQEDVNQMYLDSENEEWERIRIEQEQWGNENNPLDEINEEESKIFQEFMENHKPKAYIVLESFEVEKGNNVILSVSLFSTRVKAEEFVEKRKKGNNDDYDIREQIIL